jgi:hypothetical protein
MQIDKDLASSCYDKSDLFAAKAFFIPSEMNARAHAETAGTDLFWRAILRRPFPGDSRSFMAFETLRPSLLREPD